MEQRIYDAIVVGGGLAGLSASTFLSKEGRKVLLVEKNTEVGGLVSSFETDGFVFDAGVRAILAVVLSMLKDLQLNIEVVPSKVSIGVEDKIINVEGWKSVEDYKQMLISLYPESIDDIENFIEKMKEIMKLVDVIYGIDNPVFRDVKRDTKYVFTELLPWLPKFFGALRKIDKLNEPCDEYLKKFVKNQSLNDIITQHFFKGTPTFFALSYFTLYNGYVYPKGGTKKLPEALEKKIEEFGGEVIKNTAIKEVNPVKKYVLSETGEKYFYKYLVWGANLRTFYSITKTEELPEKIRKEFLKTKEKIFAGKPSESVFTTYLEVNLPVSYFKDLHNGHFFYTPYKDGLRELHKSELKRILSNWEKISKEELLLWTEKFLRYNTFEISIPAIRDESLAPEGKTGIIVSFLAEYEIFKKSQEKGWYEELIKKIEDEIVDLLSKTVWTSLKEKLEKQFSFTPLSIEKRVGSSGGAIVGWSFEAPIPVVSKMAQVNKSILTPIPDIYQVGQWAYNPAGTPTCIITGKLASDKIVEKTK